MKCSGNYKEKKDAVSNKKHGNRVSQVHNFS
jgi:hypothetical protein